MTTQLQFPRSSIDTLWEWFFRMQDRVSYGISSSPDEVTFPFENLNGTLKSLLDYGVTPTQILEYIRGMDEMIYSQMRGRGRVTDPRELPRPPRYRVQNTYPETCCARPNQKNHVNLLPSCSCHNCNELTLGLTECAICLEPLCPQSKRPKLYVTSCHECGNIACGRCATKLLKCPYCRSDTGLEPNFALHRLINKLEMPCKRASRTGMDTESDGLEFDLIPLPPMTTLHTQVLCLHKNCQWIGAIDQMAQHMGDSHACIVFEGSSVSLVISDFKRKAKLSLTKPRNYCLVLSYLSDIFVCKIILMGTKLKLVLVSVSKVEITDFGLWVEIGCNKKTIKGIIPFSKKRANVSVCVKSLLSLCKKKSDSVTINLMIRSLS